MYDSLPCMGKFGQQKTVPLLRNNSLNLLSLYLQCCQYYSFTVCTFKWLFLRVGTVLRESISRDITALFWKNFVEIHFDLKLAKNMDYSLCLIRIFEFFPKNKIFIDFHEISLKHTCTTPCHAQEIWSTKTVPLLRKNSLNCFVLAKLY